MFPNDERNSRKLILGTFYYSATIMSDESNPRAMMMNPKEDSATTTTSSTSQNNITISTSRDNNTGTFASLTPSLPPILFTGTTTPIPPTSTIASHEYRTLPPPPKLIMSSTAIKPTNPRTSIPTSTTILPPPPNRLMMTSQSAPKAVVNEADTTINTTASNTSSTAIPTSNSNTSSSTPTKATTSNTNTTTTTTARSSHHTWLALRQSSLPILVVGTSKATERFAHSQKYSNLAHMFQTIADHMPSSSVIPFRSIHKTILLELFSGSNNSSNSNTSSSTTEQMKISIPIRFLDGQTMDQAHSTTVSTSSSSSSTTPPSAAEVELHKAASLVTSSNEESSSNSNDLTMSQLTQLLQTLHIHHCQQKQDHKEMLAGISKSTATSRHQQQPFTEDERPSESSSSHLQQQQLLTLLKTKLTASSDLPFMKHTRWVYDELTDFTTHEMFHCPLVIVMVASTEDTNVSQIFQELLLLDHHLPKSFRNGQFDPSDYTQGHGGAKRYLLVLHDTSTNTTTTTTNTPMDVQQQQLQSTFPSIDCRFISLDMSSTSITTKKEDTNKLSSFLLQMTRDGCIPTLERRIVYLNAVVSNAKKGVKNVFKQFWRKPKTSDATPTTSSLSTFLTGTSSDSNPSTSTFPNSKMNSSSTTTTSTSGSVPYRFDTVESQTRLLADSLFLIQDYETSLSFYRLVKDDFKMDKAMLYYASIQEMIATCMYAMDNPNPSKAVSKYSRDIHYAIENALYSYTRAAEEEQFVLQQQNSTMTSNRGNNSLPSRPQTSALATRLATRLCLVLSRIITPATMTHLTPVKLMEIADLLASASSHETPLGAAILLEQASRHYLAASHLNKYAFHMLMSGHMYRSCRLERHAARCFTASLAIYQQIPQWKELIDHLHSALAQQLYSTEHYSLALLLYIELMDGRTGGKISTKNLNKFWNHILEICKNKPAEAKKSAKLLREVVLGPKTNVSKSISPQVIEDTDDSIVDSTKNANDAGSLGDVDILEICNLDLPRIYDSTVEVFEIASILGRNDEDSLLSSSPLGAEGIGAIAPIPSVEEESTSLGLGSDNEVWVEMTNMMEAELRASHHAKGIPISSDEVLSSLHAIEIEKAFERKTNTQNISLLEKQAATRFCEEPFLVSIVFANPLETQLELNEIQLVAELKSKHIDGVSGSNLLGVAPVGNGENCTRGYGTKTWTFDCCPNLVFKVPLFYAERSSTEEEEGSRMPFFCVEVKDVLMDAASFCKVTLAICPFMEGEFKILGVRYKIFDSLWAYHHFSIKGPIMQDTRLHRAHRIRCPSSLLKSTIIRKMPLLHVDVQVDAAFNDDASLSRGCSATMLEGEISNGRFSIRNVGKAPANHVFLKTNAPWICLHKQPDNPFPIDRSAFERIATGNCIGPTGTLMQLIPFNSVLNPGDFVDVLFQMKASSCGKRELCCLFSYECADQRAKVTAPYSYKNNGVRTVKKKIDLQVYPSLTVWASIIPSFSNKEENILSIELNNCRSDHQDQLGMSLDQVFIFSKSYRARKLEENLQEDASLSQLGWQERIVLHYRLLPSPQDDRDCDMSMFETNSLQTRENHEGMHAFACMEHAHERFNLNAATYRRRLVQLAQQKQSEIRDIAQIRRDKSKAPSSVISGESVASSRSNSIILRTEGSENGTLLEEPTSLTRLCTSSDSPIINVICKWQGISCRDTQSKVVLGLHHALQLPVYPPAPLESCPLTITAKYKSKVHHDFRLGTLDVPFEVTVCNKIASTTLDSSVANDSSVVDFEFSVIQPPDFELSGTQKNRCKLSGGEDLSFPMNGFFSAGGVYNLQCICLTIFEADGVNCPYFFPFQWIVHVYDERNNAPVPN